MTRRWPSNWNAWFIGDALAAADDRRDCLTAVYRTVPTLNPQGDQLPQMRGPGAGSVGRSVWTDIPPEGICTYT